MSRNLIRSFLFSVISLCMLWPAKVESRMKTNTLPGSVNRPAHVVAKDGSGDYTTVQAAVDAAPMNSATPYTIHIRNGIYKEVVTISKGKDYLVFIGESADKTILTYDNNARKLDPNGVEFGTSNSASTFIKADHFRAERITFENSAGMDASQALAINITGNYAAFKNCRFLGNQDTYFAANNTTQYLKDCYIEGTVDFIFGGSTAIFENCTIHSLRHGYLTAASTPEGKKYGYVFLNCKLTGVAENGSVYLGRPWRPHAKVVFINSEMDSHIRPEGWDNWRNPANEKTAFFAEYNNKGPGSDIAKRQKWSHQLTEAEAREYTVEKVLGTWKPFR